MIGTMVVAAFIAASSVQPVARNPREPLFSIDAHMQSYHVLSGLDVPIGRRVAIGMELTRRWVRDGLGSGGISAALGETDLGGTTMLTRIRVIF